MNQELKRYLISSAITFVSVFLLVAGAQVADVGETELTSAGVFGIIGVAVRAAVKAVAEGIVKKGV